MEQRRSRRFHLHFFHTAQSLLNFSRITIHVHRIGKAPPWPRQQLEAPILESQIP